MQRRESNVWRRNGSICTYDAITETRVPAAAMDDDVEVGGELRHHELTCTFYTKWEITLTVPPPSIRAFTNEPYKAMETLSASQSTTSPTLTTPCSFNYFFKLLEITIIMTLMLCMCCSGNATVFEIRNGIISIQLQCRLHTYYIRCM